MKITITIAIIMIFILVIVNSQKVAAIHTAFAVFPVLFKPRVTVLSAMIITILVVRIVVVVTW